MQKIEIQQVPITENHKSSFFFDGVIAEGQRKRDGKTFYLRTDSIPELVAMYYDEDTAFVGDEIIDLAKEDKINDEDIKDRELCDIHVDAWFVISDSKERNELTDMARIEGDVNFYDDSVCLICSDDYDQALEEFQVYLDNL
jgi:hypothetical protein